jgi:hypothetical protein
MESSTVDLAATAAEEETYKKGFSVIADPVPKGKSIPEVQNQLITLIPPVCTSSSF